ncbi:MAG TPA: aminotransferase class V-fold PLP-dependent enzyme [Nocardioidaceae bacterium]|nr:aminotransferase class V-fold PLP-dependent enzyme [Nocardioidaceae bacterium]
MERYADPRDAFDLATGQVHLNHGSFGAVPMHVTARQDEIVREQRRNFHEFYDRALFGLLEESRLAVADWLGVAREGFVFSPNATTALATALSCLDLGPGDEVVTTSVEYPSTYANLRRRCRETGTELVVVDVEGLDDAALVDRILASVSPATAAVVVSAVTSPWATLLPVRALHDALSDVRAVLVVDGAHVPGLVEVDLAAMDTAFFCTTLHKWACFPRGTGGLYVPASHRERARPLVDALFAGSAVMTERFAWSGTADHSGVLVARQVLDVHATAAKSGWSEAAEAVADHARKRVEEAWPEAVPVSDPRVRRMCTWRLPRVDETELATFLRERGVWTWLGRPGGHAHLRLSAAWYNTDDDVERLVDLLRRFRAARHPSYCP